MMYLTLTRLNSNRSSDLVLLLQRGIMTLTSNHNIPLSSLIHLIGFKLNRISILFNLRMIKTKLNKYKIIIGQPSKSSNPYRIFLFHLHLSQPNRWCLKLTSKIILIKVRWNAAIVGVRSLDKKYCMITHQSTLSVSNALAINSGRIRRPRKAK